MLIPTCIHLKSDRQFRCLVEGIHFEKSHAIFSRGKTIANAVVSAKRSMWVLIHHRWWNSMKLPLSSCNCAGRFFGYENKSHVQVKWHGYDERQIFGSVWFQKNHNGSRNSWLSFSENNSTWFTSLWKWNLLQRSWTCVDYIVGFLQWGQNSTCAYPRFWWQIMINYENFYPTKIRLAIHWETLDLRAFNKTQLKINQEEYSLNSIKPWFSHSTSNT